MLKSFIWIYLSIALGFSSCAYKVLEPKISPVNASNVWVNGSQISSDTIENIICMVQFSHYTEDALIFNVGFDNLSDRPILVDPNRFYSMALNIVADERHPEKYMKAKKAYNPEYVMEHINDQINALHAEQRRDDVFTGIFLFASIVEAVASTRETPEEARTRRTENNTFYANQRLDEIDRKNSINHLQDVKGKLAKSLLRKNTVFQGKSSSGLVHFKRHNAATRFAIYLVVEGNIFRFEFNHFMKEKVY